MTHRFSRYLSRREQYCVAISALCAAGRRAEALTMASEGIRTHRIPVSFFIELYVHLSLFLGFPTMLEGLEFLRKYPQKTKRGNKNSISAGRRVFQRIYGEQTQSVLKSLAALHPELVHWILRDAYGRVFTRIGMSLKERELSNVATLGVHGFVPQFFSHVKGAVRVGVSRRAVKESLDFISAFARIDKTLSARILGKVSKSSARGPSR
jgi:4-carboxymuconolactone decarboxylase